MAMFWLARVSVRARRRPRGFSDARHGHEHAPHHGVVRSHARALRAPPPDVVAWFQALVVTHAAGSYAGGVGLSHRLQPCAHR
jgi:hypothetical protein